MRAAGGWNNNPRALQFRSAYKQLLMRHDITGGRGNCIPQDDTEMLSDGDDRTKEISSRIEINEITIARRYDLTLRPEPSVASDHDYCDVPNDIELSEFKSATIPYIAGCVVRMMQKKNQLFKMFSCVVNHKREDA